MRTLVQTIEHRSRNDTFTIYPLFDIHLGAEACDEKLLERTIEEIRADPHAYVILGGDNINAITRGDRRSNEYERASWLRGEEDTAGMERDRLIKMFAPVAHRILAVVDGNHEQSVLHWDHRNIYWEIVAGLADVGGQLPEDIGMGIEGFLVLRFARSGGNSTPSIRRRVFYLHHGWGGGRKKGGKVNKLDDLMATYQADLYLMGHVHEIAHIARTVVSPGTGKAQDCKVKERHGLICGTFLRSYLERGPNGMPRNTYAQNKGYSPAPVGHPKIRITPWQDEYELVIPAGTGR